MLRLERWSQYTHLYWSYVTYGRLTYTVWHAGPPHHSTTVTTISKLLTVGIYVDIKCIDPCRVYVGRNYRYTVCLALSTCTLCLVLYVLCECQCVM